MSEGLWFEFGVTPNKYWRWYIQLVNRAKGRILDGYSERHHIWPKSLGGGNGKENIVQLTYREHFLVHWLLTKFTNSFDKRKMLFALLQMRRVGRTKGRVIASWQFDVTKRAITEAFSGYKMAESTKKKLSIAHKGKSTMSRKAKEEMSKRMKGNKFNLGKKASEETKKKMSETRRGKRFRPLGYKHTEEFKKETSLRLKGNKYSVGRKLSEDHIKQLRLGNKRYWDKVREEKAKKNGI